MHHAFLVQFGLEPCSCKTASIGDRFGRLRIIGFGKKGRRVVHAVCQCDCGEITASAMTNLKRGKTISCGCYRSEQKAEQMRRVKTKHNLSRHPLYKVWKGMMERCYNKTHIHYESYGGRGITVCDQWLSLTSFVSDMGASYVSGLTLDRSDNDLGYSKENCRWVPMSVQNRNRRNNRKITFYGKTLTIAEWAREINMPRATLYSRINRGWPLAKALSN